MKKSTKLALGIAAVLPFASATSFAATATSLGSTTNTDLTVKAHVVASCHLDTPTALDFGAINADTKNSVDGQTTISVNNCYTVNNQNPSLYIATGAGSTNTYQMTDSAGNVINYGLFSDASHTASKELTPYNASDATGKVIPISNGVGSATIYGQIPAGQDFSGFAGQSFSQTVHVQVEF
ncbi:spore coat U domain-containing protein [Vibrio sp. S4M6]|uniref:spore coat protein U domain-containing protein n=1 Tax=Vibrio sinus TaxID=2946865 RepID=UPI00202A9FEC|nr:spore coat protein U domain-containing protein [Vibrio sinus]MCL9779911.1 spore coat U domain-containing protein [Vibrio sinus]